MRMCLSVSQLTCLGACVSCGCCTPKQEGWSPPPQEPENDTWAQTFSFPFKGQEHHLVVEKHSYLPVNFIIIAVVISRITPDRELKDKTFEERVKKNGT